MYLNCWMQYFIPKNDITHVVPIWVCLPFLPLHCWNNETLREIGNALGKYIDKSNPKEGFQAYARICVEVDLEIRLPEAIQLNLDSWFYLQEVYYKQLLFKRNIFHEYGHFARNYPKVPVENKEKQRSNGNNQRGINKHLGKEHNHRMNHK